MPEPGHPVVSAGHLPAARTGRARRLFALLLLVAAGFGLAAWAVRSVLQTASTEVSNDQTGSPRTSQQVGPEVGAIAPPFDVPGYDGRGRVRLAAFRGHLVLLNFWASWCAPCRAEARTLESTYLKYKDRGVVFVGIDMQEDTWGDSRAFLRQFRITYPVGRDETGAVGRTYRVTAIPTTYFVGPDSRILTVPITGGFTGKDGLHDLVAQLEKWLHATAAQPSP